MSLAGVSKQTLALLDRGAYESPVGHTVSVRDAVDAAIRGTVLYRPDDLSALGMLPGAPAGAPPRCEVTAETTAEAARRLVEVEGHAHVAALNFASAKNPGGGWLGGAKAQEEDLARCSALYPCLLTQREYYDQNRAEPSMLYTDHLIYSPEVPFFRDDRLDLLEAPFLVSIVTAPAPNRREAQSRPGHRAGVSKTLRARAGHVLAVAAAHEHRCLVLGAWGCGVFGNDPSEVAEVFATWLNGPRFLGAFDRVVFGIHDRSKDRATLRAFQERFAVAAS